jgi:hypothetical protein
MTLNWFSIRLIFTLLFQKKLLHLNTSTLNNTSTLTRPSPKKNKIFKPKTPSCTQFTVHKYSSNNN